jgi:LPS O-antigen subunit length determinant protein (WzzB/FepE family)
MKLTEENFRNLISKDLVLAKAICQDHVDEYQLDDANIICKILMIRLGLSLSVTDAIQFWERHSRDWDAGWLSVKSFSGDDIVKYFLQFVEKYINEEVEEKMYKAWRKKRKDALNRLEEYSKLSEKEKEQIEQIIKWLKDDHKTAYGICEYLWLCKKGDVPPGYDGGLWAFRHKLSEEHQKELVDFYYNDTTK